MKKRKLILIILINIIIIAGIAGETLYKLGDEVFDEVLEVQIDQIDKVVKETQSDSNKEEQAITVTASPINKESKPSTTVKKPKKSLGSEPQISKLSSELQISKEKLEEIKESITPSDKIVAAALVLAKLDQSDIKELTDLSVGGITSEEKEKMKTIVYSRFTEEEIEKIKGMYIKYMK